MKRKVLFVIGVICLVIGFLLSSTGSSYAATPYSVYIGTVQISGGNTITQTIDVNNAYFDKSKQTLTVPFGRTYKYDVMTGNKDLTYRSKICTLVYDFSEEKVYYSGPLVFFDAAGNQLRSEGSINDRVLVKDIPESVLSDIAYTVARSKGYRG